MRIVFVLFDSLNRLALGLHGGAVRTPDFDRFAERAVVFDTPLRRQPALHAGAARSAHRPAQLHAPELGTARAVRQLDAADPERERRLHPSDQRSPALFRGWRRHLSHPLSHLRVRPRPGIRSRGRRWSSRRSSAQGIYASATTISMPYDPAARSQVRLQHAINREFIQRRGGFPGPRSASSAAFEFLERNRGADNWFLQIECFDPHEPFHAPERFKQALRDRLQRRRSSTGRTTRRSATARRRSPRSAPTTPRWSRCATHYFGQLLDFFDAHDLWRDTALDPHHRPRLPARRARLVGQEPHALLRGDLRTSR